MQGNKRVFLEINVVLAILFNQKSAFVKMQEFAGYKFCISRLVYVEFFAGAPIKEKSDTHKFLSRFFVVSFSDQAQKEAIKLSRLFFLGRERKPYDLLIAAHALSENTPIITSNAKDFKYPELKVFDFSKGKWID
jgi:predicted nucleic acid-binding protein